MDDHLYAFFMDNKAWSSQGTLDSVPRFRTPILKILGGWMADHSLRERMSEQAIVRGRYQTKEEAQEGIILIVGEITDTYERLDEMLQEIDRKNSAYTRASMEKMQYLLNSDRSIKGEIVDLLLGLAIEKDSKTGHLSEQMSNAVQLFKQGYMTLAPSTCGKPRRKKNESDPLDVGEPDEDTGEEVPKDFIDKAKKSYSHQRVMNFMREVMKGKDVISSAEIPLSGDEEFILLMLASLKGTDKNTFYTVEFFEDYLQNNSYRIPRMRFIRQLTASNNWQLLPGARG